MEIRILRSGDEGLVQAAVDVFDDPPLPNATREFLADPRHHLAVAIEDGAIVGFASAVHYLHPDKRAPELWINEVGVAARHQGRGIGKAVVRALLARGRELGCTQAWVLTGRTNSRAMRLYTACGGVEGDPDTVLFNFPLRDA